MLGLAAGAMGWSGLAIAESEDSQAQTLLLPDHYILSDDGLVTFSLQSGEQLSLNPDQYVILQDGLLLITDELAQASMQSLPVMGSIRAQLTSELQPVRSPDGSVVLASDASPLWSGEGLAPRLFEEVDIQRYELAQNSSESQTQSGGNLGQAAGAAAGGLSLVGLSLTKGVFGTKPAQTTEESPAPAPAPTGDFLSNTMFQALVPATARAFTGSADDSYIGYTTADPTAQDALIDAGKGLGNSATFDMTAGGDNLLLAASSAGASSGAFTYTGGSGKDDLAFFGYFLGAYYGTVTVTAGEGDNTLNGGSAAAVYGGALSYTGGDLADSLTFGAGLGASSGNVTLNAGNGDNILTAASSAASGSGALTYTGGSGKDDLAFGVSLGAISGTVTLNVGNGDNTLNAGTGAAVFGGALSYTGGDLADSLTFGAGLGASSGNVTLNAGNGDNILTAASSAASGSGALTYTGGSGKDDLAFGDNLGAGSGTVTLNVGDGDNTLNAGSGAAQFGGTLIYNGGTGSDVLTLANGLAYFGNSTVQLDLGNDSSYDAIAFTGSVAGSATGPANYVKIINYDVTNDAITATLPITANDFRLDGNDIHWERPSDIYITFVGLGPTGDNIAISALTGTISA